MIFPIPHATGFLVLQTAEKNCNFQHIFWIARKINSMKPFDNCLSQLLVVSFQDLSFYFVLNYLADSQPLIASSLSEGKQYWQQFDNRRFKWTFVLWAIRKMFMWKQSHMLSWSILHPKLELWLRKFDGCIYFGLPNSANFHQLVHILFLRKVDISRSRIYFYI